MKALQSLNLPMIRRRYVRVFAVCLALVTITLGSRAESKSFSRHIPARVVVSSEGPSTLGTQRAPFTWQTASVGAGRAPLLLLWPELPPEAVPTHLRIAIGVDERDEKTVEVFLPQTGRLIGVLDLRFVTQFQIYQLTLSPADAADIRREGAALRLTSGSDLEIFTGGPDVPNALLPHLLVPGTADAFEEFFERIGSLACVQQFGWMEGCVLDGLLDLSALPQYSGLGSVARRHLGLFFRDNTLIYENHLSAPSDGILYGIESTLPFAALARTEPSHPLLNLALDFWQSRRHSSGSIQDGAHMSSEGAYTVAYPLAWIAKVSNSDALMQDALYQCRIRQARLFDGREFWRFYNDNGRRGNRNWARGVAWQMLGLTRTLILAKDRNDIGDLVIALQRFAEWAIMFQREDGLWSVFIGESTLTPDTAGSAGIAAALALGAKHGWLDENAAAAARRTLGGLHTYLTPDGFLGGVSQSNKGGEALQRGDYRSIYQMGMGLMAQLIAALETPAPLQTR